MVHNDIMIIKSFRILVASVDFYGIGMSFASALRQLGSDVLLADYTPLKYNSNIGIRILIGRLFSENIRAAMYNWDNERITRSILKKAKDFNPDLVIIYKGRYLSSAILDEGLRRMPETRWVCWVMDPIEHFTILEREPLKCMDAVFVYDRDDLKFAKTINQNSYYLPAGYDSSQYFPRSDSKAIYNLSFVGSLLSYRMRYLEDIILDNKLSEKQVKIIGGNWPGLFLSKKLNSNNYSSFLWQNNYISPVRLDPEQVNRLYNQSDI